MGSRLTLAKVSNSWAARCWIKPSGWVISSCWSALGSRLSRLARTCWRRASRSAWRLHCSCSKRSASAHCRAMRCTRTIACSRSAWPTSTSSSRFSGSCMRRSACCTSSSPAPCGSRASMLACNGGPARHCQALSASSASSRARNRRGRSRLDRWSRRKGEALRFAQAIVDLALRQAQQGAVTLGFRQLDTLDQCATLDMDGAEDLLQQPRARRQAELPGLGIAAQLQLEVVGQAGMVAPEHGEEQPALLRGDVLSGLLLPALGRAPGNALVADAVVLLQRAGQLPEQAMRAGQDELAAAGQRLRQGAQGFFLDERAAHHGRLGQLGAEVLEGEGLGQAGTEQRDADGDTPQETPHASAFSTASSNTRGEASCISRLAIATATCTLLPRVMRSPVSASEIR